MLPRPLTSFIGREDERRRGCAEVSSHRLVTVTGPPGVGKTRLAVEIAADLDAAFDGRCWFVDLTAVSAPALVETTVLAAVDSAVFDGEAAAVFARRLGGARALLVLDNCEQVREATAEIVLRLTEAAEGLHVLVTSRVSLGLAGEHLLPLTPLDVDGAAVALFLDRARSDGAAVDDDRATRDAARAVCQQLDGLPLAIELAAAQVRHLGVERLARLLDEPLQALPHAPKRARLAQRPLADAIAASHRLCTPAQQQAWAALSVFAGDFGVDEASMILAASAADGEPHALLGALVDQSILMTVPREGAMRYRLLATLAAFGRAELARHGREPAVRDAHARWYARIGADLELGWVGPGQAERLRRADAEIANLRAAADHVISSGRHTDLLHDLVALPAAELWWTTGRIDEGGYWLARALGAHREPDGLRGRLLMLAATFAYAARKLDDGDAYLAELDALALPGAYAVGARAFAAGFGLIQHGELEQAVDVLRAGIAVADAEPALVRMQLRSRQLLVFACNGLRRNAAETCDEMLAISQHAGEDYYRAFAEQMLALRAWRRGDAEAARGHLDRALHGSIDFADRPENADLLRVAGLIEERWGDPQVAATLMAAAGTTDRVRLQPAMLGTDELAEPVARLRRYAAAARTGAGMSAREALAFAVRRTNGWAPTPRQLQVADLIRAGRANKQIAVELGLSPKTVEGHIARLMAGLGVSSRAQIAAWAAHPDPAAVFTSPASGPAR
ncbi:ATP-binding protein [Microbacterium luticocti]|uniref:ATP-binding protein n=1 Tax=Microbacterium luticocti TaxID=451764 RepID=UPI0012EB1F4C|nr:LuxR C-terminal-related transcriptional regulator [Microbacterium luticocti]